MNILVTQLSYHSSIGVVKLLKDIKNISINIIGCSYFKKGYAPASLLVNKYYQVSKNLDNKYLDDLLKIYDIEKIDFIISAEIKEFDLFSSTSIESKCVFADKDIINLFSDKLIASNSILNLNLKIPKIFGIKDINDRKKYIVRKKISECSEGIKFFDSIYNLPIEIYSSDYFIQEFIEGDEYTVDVFCDKDGHPKVIIPRKRIKIRTGITVICKIIYNEKLINYTKKIYENYKIPGFSNVQFIVKNNIPYFIELNTRLGGTTIASSLVSVNLVELLIRHFYYLEELKSFDYYMEKVKWNAVVARYYEETIYMEK